ncbi:MAG TPA: sulfatase [Planctomycetota bacterium]|nr:sulfatase [Planctomycetota bacterium]
MAHMANRREFLGIVGAGAAAAALPRGALGGEAPAAQRPPNFILIFTDDQGYQDLGCFGSPDIATPCIDKMAAEGTRFTDFHVAAPVCTPSRAALLTGCYPQRVCLPNVLFPGSKVGISDKETTLAELLKARGYATACIGKWHLGHLPQFLPTRHGFDSYLGIPYSNDMTVDPNMAVADDVAWRDGMTLEKMRKEKPIRHGVPLFRDEKVIEYPADQTQLTTRYTEEAVKFITANKEKPFFLYLPHSMPHIPLFVSDKHKGKSKRGLYGDVIEEIDWSTGQILDTVRKLGLAENTCVLFTSDNGPWLVMKQNGGSALPLRDGKGTTWEGGMREPCVMWWPGRIPAGKTCAEFASTLDVLPTFAKLAGAEAPTGRIIDGRDIWPLMAGAPGAKSPTEAFFYYRSYGLEAVRSGKWKLRLARKAGGGKGKAPRETPAALYDLDADISEKNDVAAANPDVVKRLEDLAERCREDIGDASRGMPGKNRRPCGTA